MCMFTCLCAQVCVFMYVEARGLHQIFSSVILHLIFEVRSQVQLYWPTSKRQAPSACPALGLQACFNAFGFCGGAEALNSDIRAFVQALHWLSHLPKLKLISLSFTYEMC